MPVTPNVPSNPGGGPANAPGGQTQGSLQALFAQPVAPAVPVAEPVAPAPQPAAPSVPAQPPTEPAPAPQPVVEDPIDDIEPEIDPAEAANSQVLKSYQTALKKANNEARGLRTRVKELETQNEQLTTTNKNLQAQVIPTQRELAFYRSVAEDSTQIGSVLYPQLLWQALAPHLQWDQNNQATNMAEALTKARAQFPALFKPVPQVNGGSGGAEPQVNGGGNFMNSLIRGR